MKLSKRTLAILKNFASINQSIIIKPGKRLETISNVKDTFAKAESEETFDKQVSIYDLNEFLGVISLFEDPDFEFGDKSVKISEGKTTQTYFYADASVITTPPEKGVNLPSSEVTASLSREQLGKLIRSAAVNNAADLTFKNGSVLVHDKTVPNSNKFEITDVASTEGKYELSIKVEKLKMVSDDYQIKICAKGLSHFKGSQGIEYFIALQPNGSYSV
jgi:hypothetical protein